MASQAKHSAIARYIEPTRRSRNYVMHFEAGLTPASLTAPAAPTPPWLGRHASLPAAVGAGSEVSRGCLLQNRKVQRLICYQLLQSAILPFQFLQTPHLIHS